MRLFLLALAVGSATGAAGCKSKDAGEGDKTPPPVAIAAKDASLASAPGEIRQPVFEVDGKDVEIAPLGAQAELVSLKGLPKVETWKTVVARSKDGREFRGSKPMLLTGTRTMMLAKTDSGYEFRVMDKGEAGPYVRHRMPSIRRVIIHSKGYTPPDKPKPTLTMIEGDKQQVLEAAALEQIPRTQEPSGEEQRDTWVLLDLFGGREPAVGQSLILKGAKGDLTISAAELVDTDWKHMLKRNRRGELHYRAWELTNPPEKKRELRNLTSIELR